MLGVMMLSVFILSVFMPNVIICDTQHNDFSIKTLGIKGLFVTLSINKQNNTTLHIVPLS
jgi:hypothetical protein